MGSSEVGPRSTTDAAVSGRSSHNRETSWRFHWMLSSFGLGQSSRSTVLPIHLDRDGGGGGSRCVSTNRPTKSDNSEN